MGQLWEDFETAWRQFSWDDMVTTIVNIGAPLPCGQHFFFPEIRIMCIFCLLDENAENMPVNRIPLAADWALGVLHFWVQAHSAVVYFLAWFTQALGLLVMPMFCFVLSGEDAGGWWEA